MIMPITVPSSPTIGAILPITERYSIFRNSRADCSAERVLQRFFDRVPTKFQFRNSVHQHERQKTWSRVTGLLGRRTSPASRHWRTCSLNPSGIRSFRRIVIN